MASEPHGPRGTVERWSRLTPEQRAAFARRLVARSREGEPVTEQMLELLALLRGQAGKVAPPGRQH